MTQETTTSSAAAVHDPINPPPSHAPTRSDRLQTLGICLFLAALALVAHFWSARYFGLYEDDFEVAVVAAKGDWAQAWTWTRLRAWDWFVQGRPLTYIFWMGFHFLGYKLGNLYGVYLLSAPVVAANVVLFFLLIRRAFGNPTLAVLAALAFCLHPADTSRQFLVHTTTLQPSLLFCLVAMHCYLSRRWVATYLIGSLTLFTYESPFLPFLLTPLLVDGTWRALSRRLLLHWAVCGSVIALTVGVRLVAGEARVTQALSGGGGGGHGGEHSLITRILTDTVVGPLFSLQQFLWRPIRTVEWASSYGAIPWIAVASVALVAFLLPTCRRQPQPAPAPSAPGDADPATPTPPHPAKSPAYPFLVGLAMLLTSYGFAFTHYVPIAAGRLTSVHLASTVGGALVVGSLAWAIVLLASRVRLQWAAATLLGAYFALLFGFAVIVQNGFVAAARAQKVYWSNVLALCPDIGDGTLIVTEGRWPRRGFAANPSDWTDFRIFQELLRVPPTLQYPPRYYVSETGRKWADDHVLQQSDRLTWKRDPADPLGFMHPPTGTPVTPGKLIVLQVADGPTLKRLEGTITVQGQPFDLGPAPAPAPLPYPSRTFYPLLIDQRRLPEPMRTKTPPRGPLLLGK